MKKIRLHIKRTIGDILSLIYGDQKEDFEPSKNDYYVFFGIIVSILLFIFLSSI